MKSQISFAAALYSFLFFEFQKLNIRNHKFIVRLIDKNCFMFDL